MNTWQTEAEGLQPQQRKREVFLQTCVPLAILEVQRRGGPDEQDWELLRASNVLPTHGDALLFSTPARAATADRPASPGTAMVAGNLVQALAMLACVPGGVSFLGLHFEAQSEPLTRQEHGICQERCPESRQ